MAPLTRETEIAGQGNAAAGALAGAKPQPVAAEIPVTVNGARTVAGSAKREPFSETTQTVLVFGSGAVIRLTAAVGPGQLLFVTNEKSKKEVVCQVVKSKQNGSAGGYVELKFTETAVDFWGVRFPGSAVAPAPAIATRPVAPGVSAPAKSLEQRLAELKSATPAVTMPNPPQALAPAPFPPAAVANPSAAKPAAQADELQAVPVVPAQPPASLPAIPTLSDFLTQGANGPELKAADKPQTQKAEEKPEPKNELAASEQPANEAKEDQAALQRPEFLSESQGRVSAPVLSTVLPLQNAAPGSLTFDLAAEEVKIPSWLEPLARNSTPVEAKPSEVTTIELAPPLASEPAFRGEEESAASSVAEPEASNPQREEAVLTLSSAGRTPNFGSSLTLGSGAEHSESAKGSGAGWKIGLLIAVLLVAAAAAWYWYVNQPAKVSASGNAAAPESLASIPAPAPSTSAATPDAAKPGEITPEPSSPTEPPAVSPMTPAVVPAASRSFEKATGAARPPTPVEVPVEEPAKKPALGQVHLAAPVVTRKAAVPESSASDPGLALNSVGGGDANGLSLLGNKAKQPAAPLPVGGDVKPARLLSSVPPVYPQLARTQRVSGNVTLDALIDVNGQVAATRIISGPALLHQAATDAVKQWKYQPATLNDQPTAMHLTVTVQFRLQ